MSIIVRLKKNYPDVFTAYKLLLTAPMIVASAERPLSKLKMMKKVVVILNLPRAIYPINTVFLLYYKKL